MKFMRSSTATPFFTVVQTVLLTLLEFENWREILTLIKSIAHLYIELLYTHRRYIDSLACVGVPCGGACVFSMRRGVCVGLPQRTGLMHMVLHACVGLPCTTAGSHAWCSLPAWVHRAAGCAPCLRGSTAAAGSICDIISIFKKIPPLIRVKKSCSNVSNCYLFSFCNVGY